MGVTTTGIYCRWADLGEPFEGGAPGLTRLAPTAARIGEAGAVRLQEIGLPRRRADAVASLASAVANGALRLEPGSDPGATLRVLRDIDGVGERLAATIVMRALSWPDAFPASDRSLQRAAGVPGAPALQGLAERWRPWRAYAALHLRLDAIPPARCPSPAEGSTARRDVSFSYRAGSNSSIGLRSGSSS